VLKRLGYDFQIVRAMRNILIALLGALAAMAVSIYVGSFLIFSFGLNYHDGSVVGGDLVIGLMVAVVVFRAIIKRLTSPVPE